MVRALEQTSLLRIDGRPLAHKLKERQGGSLRWKRLLGCGDQLILLG